MKKPQCVIISPHFDDAGLGIPAYIKALGAAYTVKALTLNTVSVWSPGLKLRGVKMISAARAREDRLAFRFLCGKNENISACLLDAPLRGVKDVTGKNMFSGAERKDMKTIKKILAAIKKSLIVSPLGIKHIDHLTANQAVIDNLSVLLKAGNEVVFYEEMPICGMVALSEIKDRVKYIEAQTGKKLSPFYAKTADMPGLKKAMLSFYPSQIRPEDSKAVYKHLARMKNRERLWRPA